MSSMSQQLEAFQLHAATAPATRGGINDIPSTGTGGAHAHRPSSDATPRPQLGQETNLTPPWHPARTPHNHRACTFHGKHARHRESRSAHAAAAAAAATGQHHARARRPARRTHRAHTYSTAARRSAAELQAPRTNDDARRRKDSACPQEHAQRSRRRRSMGHASTGRTPRQRGPVERAGVRLSPPMRAWLKQPHGRHHKARPQPCALTTRATIKTSGPTPSSDANTSGPGWVAVPSGVRQRNGSTHHAHVRRLLGDLVLGHEVGSWRWGGVRHCSPVAMPARSRCCVSREGAPLRAACQPFRSAFGC